MGRISDLLQILSASAGILGFGIACVVAFFAIKNGTLKSANDAQSSAINALQSEMLVLQKRVDDAEQENAKLNQTIDTICAALKKLGLIVTVQGEIVSIEDKRGRSTTTRIRPIAKQDDAI
jgi:cell division protein FtsB